MFSSEFDILMIKNHHKWTLSKHVHWEANLAKIFQKVKDTNTIIKLSLLHVRNVRSRNHRCWRSRGLCWHIYFCRSSNCQWTWKSTQQFGGNIPLLTSSSNRKPSIKSLLWRLSKHALSTTTNCTTFSTNIQSWIYHVYHAKQKHCNHSNITVTTDTYKQVSETWCRYSLCWYLGMAYFVRC